MLFASLVAFPEYLLMKLLYLSTFAKLGIFHFFFQEFKKTNSGMDERRVKRLKTWAN